MKTLYLSIMILSCFVLLSVILSQNVSATVPLVEIMLSGTANNQNCENKCVISQTITVQKGSTVEWINNDLIPHTLVSGNPEDKNNGTLFDSGQIWVGKFFMYDFNDVGVYHYFEKDHPENTGIINVTDRTYPQSNNTQIQNGARSTNSTCTDDMIQDMKTKYASFDEERAKIEAVNYDVFKSEVKNDKYIFRAVSQEWINDQVKCDVTFKNALVLFVVTDSSGKDRDVTVLINPVSYKPQSIDVKYDVPTHGGVITTILSPLKQFKSGIAAKDVKCKQGLELLMKSHDNMPACVKSTSIQRLLGQGWINPYNFNGEYIGKESISLSAYQGVSNEAFYNNGTVASDFTINVNIHNFKSSNTSLVLQVYYSDGTLYKTVSVPSGMIQPDGFYKYHLIGISDESHLVPFKVVATYNNETAIAYAPVFAHP